MKSLIKFIIPISLLAGELMATVINETDLEGLPGIGDAAEVVQKINAAGEDEGPYEIIEYAWPFIDKEGYESAALWICFALQKGYNDGNAISGWIDDWKVIGKTEDLMKLVKDNKNHKHIADILAVQWKKKAKQRARS